MLDYVTARLGGRAHVPQEELANHFADLEPGLYYRLEQLRLLGFVDRLKVAESKGDPVWAGRRRPVPRESAVIAPLW